MKTDLFRSLTDSFEAHAQQTETGVEYWLARTSSTCSGTRNGVISWVLAKAKTRARCRGSRSASILLASTKWSSSGPADSARSKA